MGESGCRGYPLTGAEQPVDRVAEDDVCGADQR
jgi:hypothetical protein